MGTVGGRRRLPERSGGRWWTATAHANRERVHGGWGSSAEPLGRGMEGIVHRLDGGLVAEAWFHRSVTEAPSATGPPPRVVRAGTAVRHSLPPGGPPARGHGGEHRTRADRYSVGHRARERPDPPRRGPGGAGPRGDRAAGHRVRSRVTRPIGFGEDGPLWDEGRTGVRYRRRWWSAAPPSPVPFPRAAIPCFDTLLARLLDLLSRLPSATGIQLVHDDLRPDDVLVDSAGRPDPWWDPTPTPPPAGTDTSPAARPCSAVGTSQGRSVPSAQPGTDSGDGISNGDRAAPPRARRPGYVV